MASRAQRKRRKKERMITLAGGEQVAQKPAGRDRTHTQGPKRDEAVVALAARRARLRALGLSEGLAALPQAGCEVGLALLADKLEPDERADLWGAVCHVRKAYVSYGRAIGAPNRYAQCLRILLPAERFEVRADSVPFDDRPQEDRDRSAVAAFMAVQGWFMRGSAADLQACVSAVVDDKPLRDWAGVKRALGLVVIGMKGGKFA
jgi:hypothetical protein